MKIRTRIFLVFVFTVAAGFLSLVLWIRDDLRPRYLESLEEPLVDSAHLMAELLAADLRDARGRQQLHEIFDRAYARRFLARIYALERDRVDLRIYATDAQGIVIFDSAGGRDEGKDYSRWNDVLLALQNRYGARSTRDDPLDPVNAVVYVAAPVIVDGRIVGSVSVGKPKRNVDQFVRAAQQKILFAGAIAALLAILLGIVLSTWVTRPLEQLTEYARAVRAGERPVLPRLGRNEIGVMGEAMEGMRRSLEGKDYIERYVQTLTHELKSPLAAIRGAAELLGENPPAEEHDRFLNNIRNETRRLQDLVERLLELAAVEKRSGLESAEALPLATLVEELSESMNPLLQKLGVRLIHEIPPGIAVRGERFLIRQAIANLLQNAVDFSPAGASIRLRARKTQDSVEIEIRDEGTGIPDYAIDRIFDRFYSLPRPGSLRKGTGLGLTFVREVAQLHGGQIELRNHPAGGTVAVLSLPAA
jgi:two-component system sensor histidine kinase CreC